jgi:ribonuclease P protein component
MTGVQRNQLKRRLRELARLHLLAPLRALPDHVLDLVIRARQEAYAADVAALRTEMEIVRGRLSVAPAGPRRDDAP